ncbi:MAG: AAC(3) family N-acetyltransferase [Thermodesulfobacteriota bacterium]|nr:AAC(3) family N-acetyltransferase [Thermodesulfobacteriota bacterium]
MTGKIVLQSNAGAVRKPDILKAFKGAGVEFGDTVMIHSRLFSLGTPAEIRERSELTDVFLSSALEAAGDAGTLLFPTFTFSFCKTGLFDARQTKSEMGLLTEEARKRPGALRTLHPIYSAAILGRDAKRFFRADTGTCFGQNSLFDLLHRENEKSGRVKFLSIGVAFPPTVFTHVHYVEETVGVPYRYHKTFKGEVVADGRRIPARTRFYVRDLETPTDFDGEACWDLWREAGIASVAELGDSWVCVVAEKDLFDVTAKALRQRPDFLCRGGYRPAAGAKGDDDDGEA